MPWCPPREVKGTKKDGISPFFRRKMVKQWCLSQCCECVRQTTVVAAAATTTTTTTLPECDGTIRLLLVLVHCSFGIEELSLIQHVGPTTRLVQLINTMPSCLPPPKFGWKLMCELHHYYLQLLPFEVQGNCQSLTWS